MKCNLQFSTLLPIIFRRYAGVAQLIERFLAKEEVESLSLFTRTIRTTPLCVGFFLWYETLILDL